MNDTILIIEDNQDLSDTISKLLELAGYTVLKATNGNDGLELARQQKPDLILCDIIMPDLDGYGVLRAIENIPELSLVPFIFMTAKIKKSDFREGMDLGADDYLSKPFSGDNLLKIVSARLKKSKLLKKSNELHTESLNDFESIGKSLPEIHLLANQKTIKKVRKKDIMFMEGDSSKYLYFVVSGKVKTYKTNEFGKDYITEIYKEKDFFGYSALFGDTTHKESAMAIENSEIATIPKQDFFQLLNSNSTLSLKFIKLLSSNYSESQEKLLKLAYDSSRKRVAEALLFISRKYQQEGKSEARFILQRENISSLAGISRESVSRNLSEFRDERLIETDNCSIKIIDVQKLERLKN